MNHEPDTTLRRSPRSPRSIDEIRAMAIQVAHELHSVAGAFAIASGGGSRPRGLTEDLRMRFLAVRTALFQRGFFDPVLVRFDTATGTQASTAEIAQQLKAVAATL